MRGRLIDKFLAELAQLDVVATAADPDGAGPLTSGYDADFQETVRLPTSNGRGVDARREKLPIRIPCQVEVQAFGELQELLNGSSPRSQLVLVFHFQDLERLGLVEPATGDARLRVGDRLVAIHERARPGDPHSARPLHHRGPASVRLGPASEPAARDVPRAGSWASRWRLMLKVVKIGDWTRIGKLLTGAPARIQAAVDKAMLQEGHFLRGKIVEGIREQAPGGRAFAPLAPTTLAIRKFQGFGGTKALLVRGDLRNSITVTKQGDRVFIGVHRTAKGRAGQPLVNVAALQEHGSRPIAMRLTPKARAFLHAAFRKADLDSPSTGRPSTGIAVVQVTARPFLAPVFEKYAQPEQVSHRFLERVERNLNGDFGMP